jgi:hypothetical protein
MAKGILLVGFDYSTAHADEFHDWYDLEHIPERQNVPGFGLCRRWLDAPVNHSIATYELDTLGVLDSSAYLAIAHKNLSVWSKRVTAQCKRLTRFEGRLIGADDANTPADAGALLVNAMNVAPEHEADFNAWYDEEHLPALRAVPGTIDAWRYEGREGSTHKYAAIYYLEEAQVARSAAWKAAASSPWSDRVVPTFQDRIRVLCDAYDREVTTAS